MGLSKKMLWERIKTVLQEVNPNLARPVYLEYNDQDLMLLPMTLFREADWWLADLPELLNLRKIRAWAKPEYWKAIESDPECEDLREVRLLREAQAAIRTQFRSPYRPNLFKKTFTTKAIRSVKTHK